MNTQDCAELVIAHTIVHDVPKHKKKDIGGQVDYSDRESDLTQELKLFFRDKITQAISNKGFKVCFNQSSSSPVRGEILGLLKSPRKSIVQPSKDISKHLHNIQMGWNPAGIVVVIKGTIRSKPVLVILKLERDEGARLKKNQRAHFIDIESVRDLMLTKKTNVYKVGLFFLRDDFAADFDGFVCDNQIGNVSSGVARFFLEDFLGCTLYEDTRKMTRTFFDVGKEFIETIVDPIKKAKYYEHLLSYLNRPVNTVDPRSFITEYLDPEDRQGFEHFANQRQLPMAPFPKDNELIKSHLTKMMIDFENDVSIISKNGELGEKVKLSDAGGGNIRAEIVSKLKRVTS